MLRRKIDWRFAWARHFFMRWGVVIVIFFLLFLGATKGHAQNLEQYTPMQFGMCEDVGLRCAAMIHKDTAVFYAVFDNEGNLVAITRVLGQQESTVWGRLPLRKNEKEL